MVEERKTDEISEKEIKERDERRTNEIKLENTMKQKHGGSVFVGARSFLTITFVHIHTVSENAPPCFVSLGYL